VGFPAKGWIEIAEMQRVVSGIGRGVVVVAHVRSAKGAMLWWWLVGVAVASTLDSSLQSTLPVSVD
jgi:hypothetical protein